jgi:hypothetical protein
MSILSLIIMVVLTITVFSIVLLGPGIFATLIQWMLKNTRIPRSDAIFAVMYAVLDLTVRKENTAEHVEGLSNALKIYIIEHEQVALGLYLITMIVFYFLLIKFGKAIMRGVRVVFSYFKKRLKDCQHAPPAGRGEAPRP